MKFAIKHRLTAEVLFEAEIGSLKLAVEAAVKAKANLSGAYLREADLSGANLRGAYLDGADLRRADLIGAYLSGANLRGAYLDGADLRRADLIGAYLSTADLGAADLRRADLRGAYLDGAYLCRADLIGADLRGAYMRGAYMIDAGQDSRSYRFVAVKQKEGPYLIFAGCRSFTLEAALEYWGGRHEGELRAECMAKVNLIKTVAAARGWEAEGEPTELGPQAEAEATAQESSA